MKKYFTDILSEIQSDLNIQMPEQAFARIPDMVIASGEEFDASEMFERVYLLVARRLAAKMGVHVESNSDLWFLFENHAQGRTAPAYSHCNDVARGMLLHRHLLKGKATDGFHAVCHGLCTDEGRQQLASLFYAMENLPSVVRHSEQQGAMDLWFNSLCAPSDLPADEDVELFANELYPLTHAGVFDDVKELLGLKFLTRDELAQYIGRVVDAFEHPVKLYGDGAVWVPVPSEGVVENLVHYIWHTQDMPAGTRIDLD